MSKVADLLAARRPRTRVIRLALDGELTAELERSRIDLRDLQHRERLERKDETLASQIPAAERRVQEIEASVIAASVEFTFKAIGRRKLDGLKADHPPTADQWERYREQATVNPLIDAPTFDPTGLAPFLIAAAAADPKMDAEEARALWDDLSDGEAALVYDAAWSVNMEAASVPLSATATDETGTSAVTSTMQRVAESLGASLTDV